jgi:hypothetical protein
MHSLLRSHAKHSTHHRRHCQKTGLSRCHRWPPLVTTTNHHSPLHNPPCSLPDCCCANTMPGPTCPGTPPPRADMACTHACSAPSQHRPCGWPLGRLPAARWCAGTPCFAHRCSPAGPRKKGATKTAGSLVRTCQHSLAQKCLSSRRARAAARPLAGSFAGWAPAKAGPILQRAPSRRPAAGRLHSPSPPSPPASSAGGASPAP